MDNKGRDYVLKHMPQIGLGTYLIKDEEELRVAINSALECGYRFVDTAQVYRNEKLVGQALRDSLPDHGLTRYSIFISIF
jgi:diketogulonate reductase-like aldo/keto reductase